MNDTTWLRQIPYGGYQDAQRAQRAAATYSGPPPAMWQGPYVGQNPTLWQGPYVGQNPYAFPPQAEEQVRSIGTTLLFAGIAFALFGGLGAAVGYLIHPTAKGAVVGAYLGLAALQGSSAIRRST